MLRRLFSRSRTVPNGLGTVPLSAFEDVEDRVMALEKAEALRAAEHAQMVDRLERLYKRITARIARDAEPPSETTESPLSLRRRLQRGPV